ncbi:MAG: TonB-dependent receptor, partial [Bacteroidetes bacterium]|nr:TonB-dependent receptor [Bacteroidota bacterium]
DVYKRQRLDGGGDTGFMTSDLVLKGRYAFPDGRQSVSVKYALATESSRETYLGLTEADYATSPFRRYEGSKHDRMATRFEAAHVRYSGVTSDESLRWTSTVYGHQFHRNWYKIGSVVADGNTVGIGTVLMSPTDHQAAMNVILGSSDGLLNVRANNRNYQALGFDQRLTWRINASAEVRSGVRLHRDEVDYFQWEDQYAVTFGTSERTYRGTPGSQSNRVVSAQAFAAYTTVDFNFGRLIVSPGVRREVISYDGINYGRNDTLRLGSDVQSASSSVAVVLPGRQVFGGGFRRTAALTNLQVVAYFAGYNNLLGVDLAAAGGSGTGDLFNGGRARAWGLEVSGSYNLGAL